MTVRRIGRYEIDRELGRGALGTVYLARDSILDRRVAIKVLRDDLEVAAEERGVVAARMKSEGRAIAALSHPHVVAIHDLGDDPEVGAFLVLEFVAAPGEETRSTTLRERLREPLGIGEIVRISRALGEALTAAHDAGIVHRDLKPENILVGRYGVKIADFGLARPRISAPASTEATTTDGPFLSTPAYSAPEALTAGQYTARSDQFALGAILHELVTGKRAFAGDDSHATVRRILSGEHTPLDRDGLSPTTLETARGILGKALAARPEDRFISARALGDAFAATLDGSFERSVTPIPDSLAGVPESLRADLRSGVSPASRFRTRRTQNIAIGAAILIFAALYFFGRKRDETKPTNGIEALSSDIAERAKSARAPLAKPKPKTP